MSKQIKSMEVVSYEDLRTEEMRRGEIAELPVIVCNHTHGGDLLRDSKAK